VPGIPRRADARANDERILRAAARVLAEDPHATIQRIADEAGVVRLTVYRRYPGREALRRAIFEAAAAEAVTVIPDDGDPIAALRRLIVEMTAIARRYPLLVADGEAQPSIPATRAMRRAVRGLVRRGQESGVLRGDLPADLLPQAIVGTLRMSDADGEQIADLLLEGFRVRGRRTTA
jgi:AcrR family transcriptional regulator